MYRVMIVDDEPLILAGIASMLEWESFGCVIAGKASNGQQAMGLIEEQKPDIIITDIKMPGMDGLCLMKAAKEKGWDHIVFILLTNLEEFSLARQALSLGAVDYLVKMELTEDKLAHSLKLAMDQCDLRHKAEQAGAAASMSMEEAAKTSLTHCLSGGEERVAGWEQAEQYLREPVLVLVTFNYGCENFNDDFTREDQKKVISFAENIVGQMAKGYFDRCCLVRRELNSLILAVSAADLPDYKAQIRSLGEKISSVVKDYFEVSVSVAVSRKKESLGDFHELLYEVMSATNYYYYHSADPVVFYSKECESNAGHTGSFNIGFLKKDLSQAIQQNDSTKLRQMLDEIAGLLRENHPSKQQAVNACANLYFFLSSFFEGEAQETAFPYEVNIMEKLARLGSLDQIVQWCGWFKEEIASILERRRDSGSDKIAELVREYVIEHYRERITLGQTAQALGISQGYLSTAFKKQSGEAFTSYVSAIKIEKAKELIESRQYMMYEISDLLGFDTPFYFSKVFKKVTGLSPREFEARTVKMKKL